MKTLDKKFQFNQTKTYFGTHAWEEHHSQSKEHNLCMPKKSLVGLKKVSFVLFCAPGVSRYVHIAWHARKIYLHVLRMLT